MRPAFIAGVVLVAILAGGASLWIKSAQVHVATDSETLCPTDRSIAGLTVVLLDVSDRFSEAQRLDVENRLRRVQRALPRFNLLEVYTVEGDRPTIAKPLIHLCSPGKGDDLSQWYQNPTLARKHWNGFSDRLTREFQRLLTAPAASISPIYEAVQATALRTFGRSDYDGIDKRLIIVSDLLQNVPGKQSHYSGIPVFETFRKEPYFAQSRADLQDVHVDIFYLNRSGQTPQGAGHIRFWEQLLTAQGATVESVERIYGDN